MDDQQLLRYARQIFLPQVDVEGQARLLASRVLVLGLGGLGSPVAMYLAAAGVGHLTLVDDDAVELSNLQRQIVHDESRVGQLKVQSAAARLGQLNSTISVTQVPMRLEGQALLEAVAAADVVVDCTDNLASRQAINRACAAAKKPLVFGAAIGFEGQLSVFDHRDADSPCYHCLYPESDAPVFQTCANSGVIAPILGVMGSLQALETLKLLIGVGESMQGRLLVVDGQTMQMRTLQLAKDPACAVCHGRANS